MRSSAFASVQCVSSLVRLLEFRFLEAKVDATQKLLQRRRPLRERLEVTVVLARTVMRCPSM